MLGYRFGYENGYDQGFKDGYVAGENESNSFWGGVLDLADRVNTITVMSKRS